MQPGGRIQYEDLIVSLNNTPGPNAKNWICLLLGLAKVKRHVLWKSRTALDYSSNHKTNLPMVSFNLSSAPTGFCIHFMQLPPLAAVYGMYKINSFELQLSAHDGCSKSSPFPNYTTGITARGQP